jgi:hypothetical protein
MQQSGADAALSSLAGIASDESAPASGAVLAASFWRFFSSFLSFFARSRWRFSYW